MTGERATQIVSRVFGANLTRFPTHCESDMRDFYIGRMIGLMQKTLENELEKEVSKEGDENGH